MEINREKDEGPAVVDEVLVLPSLALIPSDSSFRLHRTLPEESLPDSISLSGGLVVPDRIQTESLLPFELEANILSRRVVSGGREGTRNETTELVFKDEDPFG